MSKLSLKNHPLVQEYQTTLLFEAERFFGKQRIPQVIRRAFLDTPRHLFAPKFYSSTKRRWIELDNQNLKEHLPELYTDHPLCIFRDEFSRTLSTISQPSLVLYMLDLLELKPGHSVFELGGGSGWNAALLGRLVGETGSVLSFEIIEELVAPAQDIIGALGLTKVELRAGDGNLSDDTLQRFDRGVFTASAWELPSCFFHRINEDGLLLFVLKAQAHYDLLCLLRKKSESSFSSELHFTCSFVPVAGAQSLPEFPAKPVSETTSLELSNEFDWEDIKIDGPAIQDFVEFCRLVFDCQQSYLVATHGADFDEEFWGIGNDSTGSLVLFNEDRIQLFGSEENLVQLRRTAKRWKKAGSLNIEDIKLDIHNTDTKPDLSNDQWTFRRGDCFFVWSL